MVEVENTGNKSLHKKVLPYFLALKSDAALAGFDLAIASSYRSFERQSVIWNEKIRGVRSILDDCGEAINTEALTDWEKVQAVLRWSALPGASRHHWGTDVDVYDKLKVTNGYKLQLTHDETQGKGVFAEFHQWLSLQIESNVSHGFYRPYDKDCGGIGCEPWHLSYRPLADRFSKLLTIKLLASVIEKSNLDLKQIILKHLDEIYERFVCLRG